MASHYAPRKARFGPLKKIVLGILQFVLGLAVLLAALWGIFTLIAKHQSFVESYYQVQSDKLTSNVRVVQLSDLHLHEFGDHNADLIERITALKPDIIAITGDMNDKLVDDYSVVTDLCTELVKIAPVYYVPGNHEWPKIVFHHSGRYQCFVSRITGFEPLIALLGLIKSVGASDVPHFSHWSPYAPSAWQWGHSPVM